MVRTSDVIVLGVGAMGVAACRELAGRGLRVIGLEQYDIGHDRGSSHGRSRVIRHAYFEDPRYVSMVREAFGLWRELEGRCGERLLTLTGCVNIGPPGHEAIEGVLRSVAEHDLRAEQLSAAQIRRRWPAFECHEGDIGVYEDDAGFLRPEQCIEAMVREARSMGVEIECNARVTTWESKENRVVVRTDAEVYEAEQLIITAGPWLPEVVRDLGAPLTVERQVQLWFEPMRPELFAVGAMPAFIHFTDEAAYYGIPAAGADGVKISRHHGGRETTADTVDRRVNRADEDDVRGYLRRHMPLADGRLLDGKVCLYTNTPDGHFIIDRHPRFPRVLIAGGFSGHGFKFAPVVGRMLADMAFDVANCRPALFSLARFGP